MQRMEGRLHLKQERRPDQGRRSIVSSLAGWEQFFSTETLDEAQRFAENVERAVARYWQTHPRPRPDRDRGSWDRRGGGRHG